MYYICMYVYIYIYIHKDFSPYNKRLGEVVAETRRDSEGHTVCRRMPLLVHF